MGFRDCAEVFVAGQGFSTLRRLRVNHGNGLTASEKTHRDSHVVEIRFPLEEIIPNQARRTTFVGQGFSGESLGNKPYCGKSCCFTS